MYYITKNTEEDNWKDDQEVGEYRGQVGYKEGEEKRKSGKDDRGNTGSRIEELNQKEEEELVNELIKLIKEKNLESKFFEIKKNMEPKFTKDIMPDSNEDWNAVVMEPWDLQFDEKTDERTRKKIEKERGEYEWKKRAEERRIEMFDETERVRREKWDKQLVKEGEAEKKEGLP